MFLAVYAQTIVCITLVQAKKERKKGRKKERSGKGARLEPLANSAQAEARVVRSQSPHEYAQSNVNRNRLQAGIVPSCVSTPWTQMNRLLSSHLLVFRQCRVEDRNNIVLESSAFVPADWSSASDHAIFASVCHCSLLERYSVSFHFSMSLFTLSTYFFFSLQTISFQ